MFCLVSRSAFAKSANVIADYDGVSPADVRWQVGSATDQPECLNIRVRGLFVVPT